MPDLFRSGFQTLSPKPGSKPRISSSCVVVTGERDRPVHSTSTIIHLYYLVNIYLGELRSTTSLGEITHATSPTCSPSSSLLLKSNTMSLYSQNGYAQVLYGGPKLFTNQWILLTWTTTSSSTFLSCRGASSNRAHW